MHQRNCYAGLKNFTAGSGASLMDIRLLALLPQIKQLKRLPLRVLAIGSLLLFSLLAHGQAHSEKVSHQAFSHQPWTELLGAYVTPLADGTSTQVDYQGLATQDKKLNTYLASLSKVSRSSFDQWEKREQLAFLINAYNAWTVKLILNNYPGIDSIKDIGSFFQSPWKKNFIPLLGEQRSLDNIEHGLIRGSGRYRDPRIHFAVNCASVGCPALRPEAYHADRLDAQLQAQTEQFLADKSRNRLVGGELYISSIFKWYGEDFEKVWRNAHSVQSFLALYADSLSLNEQQAHELAQGNIAIHYLDYNWQLNKKHK